ncbi:hypothetical protein [Terriglobus sp.]|uniref:hypothetical protein n=1 Tax=Terriglobus sp. TaxID=1889013 RepID=UPI003AFFF21F
MSYDEQIDQLESEKRACMDSYNKRINDLWMEKQEAEDPDHKHGDFITLPGGRRVMVWRGKPLSQQIIEDRGSR